MNLRLKKTLAAAALCYAALAAMETAECSGYHPQKGLSQAYRLLFQKKSQDIPTMYSQAVTAPPPVKRGGEQQMLRTLTREWG